MIRAGLRNAGVRTSDLQLLQDKSTEHRDIIAGGYDVQVLTDAISSFTSLQLIQLLRVSEAHVGMMLDYLRHHAGEKCKFWAKAVPT